MDLILRNPLIKIGDVRGDVFHFRRDVVLPIHLWILTIRVGADIEFWWDVKAERAGIQVFRVR